MVHQVLQRFGFRYSSPQSTPLPTGYSLSTPPSDESVEPSGPYPKLVGCLMYLMTCTRPDLAYPLSILARYIAPERHRPEHWEAAKRVLRYLCSTSGMGLMLGGRGPVVLTGHAVASWELRWLTYMLTDLGERPRSPQVLYVDNKAMIALCQEHRLEHIALRYFLARELQQRGQLRLAYVATRANTADIFTKALQSDDHQRFSDSAAVRKQYFFRGSKIAAMAEAPAGDGTMKWAIKTADAVPASEGVLSKGPTYKSFYAKDGYSKLEGINTVWELFDNSVKKFAKNKFLGKRSVVDGVAGPYEWQTYEEVGATVKKIASALQSNGLQPQSRVGIYGINSPEWFMTMELCFGFLLMLCWRCLYLLQACNSQSIHCVPLYDTLGPEAVEFILNHAEVSLVAVMPANLSALLKSLPKCTEHVKAVISMGAVDEESSKALKDLGIKALSWEDAIKEGESNPAEPIPPKPEDICTIMYTSGTTGEPKGVLLTHRALLAAIAGNKDFVAYNNINFGEDEMYLSYLPLAHIFDRSAEELITYFGGAIGFWRGDVKLLTEDIAELKPTFFCGVPRIFDRIYAGVKAKVEAAGGISKFLFDLAYSRKQARIRAGVAVQFAAPISDAIVFNKIKARLGGKVKAICSGAAPLAPHVEEFLKITMCCPVVQGYGLTETNASGFISYTEGIEQAGTVGPPMPTLETRLESVPDMNYDALATPARGEICLRGPILFSGYYKRDDLTKEAIDDEGWFHTGDVGEWQADGSMKIVDRKKNIFKLAQGEYVAVENLENVYGNCSAIDMVWVYGNSFEAVLVAVVVPNQPALEAWAKGAGVEGDCAAHCNSPFEAVLVAVVVPNQPALEAWAKGAGVEGDYAALCQTPEAKSFILEKLVETGKKGQLKGFEMVKGVHLDSVPFDADRDLLTPTFKKKRPQLLKYYQEPIDAMYAKLKA
ncbi:unnamed protein product [Closterium sp. NIES-54]